MISGFGNGQEVFDTGGAISRLSFTPTVTTGTVAEWREMASEAHRQSQAYDNAAQEMLTWTKTDRSAHGTSSERSYVLRTLPSGVWRGLADADIEYFG